MSKRIKLADRELPTYSKGEEIFNMVSHIVGGALGIAALVLCIITAAKAHLFHSANPPFRSNMWFMGPEPRPRSSMAASAPEIYALARSTDWSRS